MLGVLKGYMPLSPYSERDTRIRRIEMRIVFGASYLMAILFFSFAPRFDIYAYFLVFVVSLSAIGVLGLMVGKRCLERS